MAADDALVNEMSKSSNEVASSISNREGCISTGDCLVSAGDGGELILWKAVKSTDGRQGEEWKAAAVLR